MLFLCYFLLFQLLLCHYILLQIHDFFSNIVMYMCVYKHSLVCACSVNLMSMCLRLTTWNLIIYQRACKWNTWTILTVSVSDYQLSIAIHLHTSPCAISPIYCSMSTGAFIIQFLFRQQYCWEIIAVLLSSLKDSDLWAKLILLLWHLQSFCYFYKFSQTLRVVLHCTCISWDWQPIFIYSLVLPIVDFFSSSICFRNEASFLMRDKALSTVSLRINIWNIARSNTSL